MSRRGKIEQARWTGCLLGGAVGDALGAPVEFLSRTEILRVHGPQGVTQMVGWSNDRGTRFRRGSFTDDTQMTIATAVGLLRALQELRQSGLDSPTERVWDRYQAWLSVQDIASQSRYPGSTCLGALRGGEPGSVDDPLNDSKGSGGIMRIAPVGLAYGPGRAFEAGSEIAALTHGHPSGYLAAGVFAEVVSRCVRGWQLTDAIAEARELLLGWDDLNETLDKLDLAVELFMSDADLEEAYEMLGQGWVADEALGIALFSALSFPEDFAEGVLAAVNITGDSDTTGSLTGSLLGALLGCNSVPGEWVREVEDRELLVSLADDVYAGYIRDEPIPWEKYPAS